MNNFVRGCLGVVMFTIYTKGIPSELFTNTNKATSYNLKLFSTSLPIQVGVAK